MMKKSVALAAALAATAAFADMKIGTVAMLKLVRNHSSYESNRKFLLETEKDYSRRIDEMKRELETVQEEGKKIADQLRNPLLAQAAKTKLEKELVDIQNRFLAGQQRIRSEAMRSQQELQGHEARLLKATTEDLRGRIRAFADAQGYDLIVDQTAVPFAKASLDVTDAVLRSMGVDPEKAKDEKNESK